MIETLLILRVIVVTLARSLLRRWYWFGALLLSAIGIQQLCIPVIMEFHWWTLITACIACAVIVWLLDGIDVICGFDTTLTYSRRRRYDRINHNRDGNRWSSRDALRDYDAAADPMAVARKYQAQRGGRV